MIFTLVRFLAPLCFIASLGATPPPPLPDGAFTIAVIPDTQGYDGAGTKRSPASTAPVTNPVLTAHLDWLLAHRAAQNIVFVSHVGDIVDINEPAQWRVAHRELSRLHGVVPFALTVGNHDMESDGNASLFQRYFPAADFARYPWYAGSFEPAGTDQQISGNNVNSAQLFSAGGYRFVHLSLECNAPDPVIAWADALLTRHADRIALITTHMDLGPLEKPRDNDGFIHAPKGRMQWSKIHGPAGNPPTRLWDKLYRKHANLLAVFSGDQSRTVAMHLTATGDHGNTVHALLSDYSSSGPLRLYRFDPTARRIEVVTYDTTQAAIVTTHRYVPEANEHQFVLPWNPPDQARDPAP